MENKSRQEIFEEKLKTFNKIKAMIDEYKTSDISEAAELEGEFMINEIDDLRAFLGDRIRGTKLFTIGENNMSREELQKEMKTIRRFITNQSLADNPEFSEEIYEMLYDECEHVYNTFDVERQLDQERWSNFDLDHSKSKFDREKIGYTNARRQARERAEATRKAWKKQQDKNKALELEDASDKSKFRRYETGRGEFGRG